MEYPKKAVFPDGDNPFAQRLGMVLAETGHDYARVEKTVAPEDANPLGIPHGGVYFAMADEACGSILDARGEASVTVNADYHFFLGARVGDRLTAEAREIKPGRTICVCEARVTNQDGTLLGVGTFTLCRLDRES